MKSYLVSLRFNPAHISHLLANYKLYQELGYEPTLILNKKYKNYKDLTNYRIILFTFKNFLNIPKPKNVVFWFPSIGNILFLLKFKLNKKTKLIYVFHEPFDSFVNYYKSGFKIFKIVKISLVNLISLITTSLCNTIILPSKKAAKLYEKNGIFFNKNYFNLPLMFDNELDIDIPAKKYISYIGTANPDHSFEEFINYILFAIKNNIFPDYKFLIASKSDLSYLFESIELKKSIDNGKIILWHNKFMTNKEINKHYLDSVIVWNAYSRTTQSGVLPKAYMFGCAVLSLEKNRNEFIINNKTGIYLKSNSDSLEITNAINKILIKKEYFKFNCRNFFNDIFFYKSMVQSFQQIIN